ncbi:MAG: hypothetical protein ABGY96_07005 [bacterium]|nr:hypothetical protein [Gammaproteobacteria bacterium]HIL98765.1 hypothetical protein [Pseudomonadales bacterium]
MSEIIQENVEDFPSKLCGWLDDLKYSRGKGLSWWEIEGIVCAVVRVAKKPALMSLLVERYSFTFEAPLSTLCEKAIWLNDRGNEFALVPHLLPRSLKDKNLFFLILMVVAYINGSMEFAFLQKVAVKKTGYSRTMEALYLANLTEALACFFPVPMEPGLVTQKVGQSP